MARGSDGALRTVLGTPTKTTSSETRFDCPFCVSAGHGVDTKQHLYVNLDKGLYFCFRCGAKGSLRSLYGKLGLHFEDTPQEPSTPLSYVVDALSRKITLGGGVAPVPYPCLHYPAWDVVESRTYLQLRGVTEEQAVAYKLFFGEIGGIARIGFPVFRPEDPTELIFWTARKFRPEDEANKKAPKYTTPRGLPKSCIFGLSNLLSSRSDLVVITEGPLSALAAGPKAVATLSKNYTPLQVAMLLRCEFSEYVVSYDSDARHQSLALCRDLLLQGATVSLVTLPPGEDPASVTNFPHYLASREEVTLSSLVSNLIEA